jgi:hypothetical protein
MRMFKGAIAAIAALMSIAGCTPQKTGIAAVADAMGAMTLNSIEYSGSGSLFGFGQAFIPGERWPRFEQRSYVASINYQTPAMRLNTVRSQGEHPPRGGAAQPKPEVLAQSFLTEMRTVSLADRFRSPEFWVAFVFSLLMIGYCYFVAWAFT